MRGSQEPRVKVWPDGVKHPRWSEVKDFVARLGIDLDAWQWLVLEAALMRTRDRKRWAAFTVGLCAPRQNGKNVVLEVRELLGAYLLGEPLVIHSAHLADTSREAFRRLEILLDMNEWLSKEVRHVWRTNGHESIEFRNGNRIRFRTRTRGGGRGFSQGSPLIFDESMIFPDVSSQSILPIASAHPDPQLWYAGSAVDQLVMDEGVVFARVRERALAGDPERMAYFEWSLPYDMPDEVTDEVAGAVESWAATNPTLGDRISEEYVRAEQRELSARAFAVERLGVGDWPPTGVEAQTVISLEDWDSIIDLRSRRVGDVCFAFDVSPSRSSGAIAVCGTRADGLQHIEVVDHRPGTGWLVARLAELEDVHEPAAVVCGSASPAASLVHELENADVKVELLRATDEAKACGTLVDHVTQARLRHLGTQELRAAIRGAKPRPLGDAWAWARAKSEVDITPLVAASLALYAQVRERPSVYEDRDVIAV